jgi:hypothetical protein
MNRALVTAIMILFASGCNTGSKPPARPADADLAAYNSTARLEFDQGEMTHAAESYTRALNRARVMDDPTAISAAAYDLAICRATLADDPGAILLLEEAEREAVRCGANLTDILLVEAKIALLRKEGTDAVRLADAVLTRPGSQPSDAQRLQARVTQGLAACQMKDLPGATQRLTEARTLADHLNNAPARAAVVGLSGEIHLLKQDFSAAATDFDQQVEWCRQSRDYRDMRRALAQAGRAGRAAGDWAKAADRLYRAARAAAAREDAGANALATEALAAARAAGDSSLVRLASALLKEARAATQPAGK